MPVQNCEIDIPAGYKFKRFGVPSKGEHIVVLNLDDCIVVQNVLHSVVTMCVIVEPIQAPTADEFTGIWQPIFRRRVYLAMDERPKGRWIMYSDERLPVYDPKIGQWSGDVLCTLNMVRELIPSLCLPEGMVAAESLRWVE